MADKKTDKASKEQIAMWSALVDAKFAVTRQEEELIAQAEWIGRDMARLATSVKAGGILNSLGELQGRGAALDVKVAVLSASRENLANLTRLAERLGMSTDTDF